MNMKKTRGFTLVELLIVVMFVAAVAAGCSVAVLVVRALLKYISS